MVYFNEIKYSISFDKEEFDFDNYTLINENYKTLIPKYENTKLIISASFDYIDLNNKESWTENLNIEEVKLIIDEEEAEISKETLENLAENVIKSINSFSFCDEEETYYIDEILVAEKLPEEIYKYFNIEE